MKFEQAAKLGLHNWAMRLSEYNIVISKLGEDLTYIFNSVEVWNVKSYENGKFLDWLPYVDGPDYICDTQLRKWYKEYIKRINNDK